ncbi:MAG: GtrA family protein [Dongiaceae bacterium]
MKSERLRPARYILVGAICAALYNAVMIFGERAGLGYVSSSILSLFAVIPTGYLLHVGFTFGAGRSWSAFFRFAVSILAGFPISLLTVALLSGGAGLSMVIAAPVATLVLFVWNYATAHWAILGRFGFR